MLHPLKTMPLCLVANLGQAIALQEGEIAKRVLRRRRRRRRRRRLRRRLRRLLRANATDVAEYPMQPLLTLESPQNDEIRTLYKKKSGVLARSFCFCDFYF